METKLEHDPSAVPLDGPDSNLQKCSDLLVGSSLCQEADDLRLARSCAGTGALLLLTLAFGLERSFQHDSGHSRGEETIAVRNGLDGFDEALGEIGFQNVPLSPGVQCPLDHAV